MLLFLDTEFTDFIHPELISLGIVTEDGKNEYYVECNEFQHPSDFVREAVIPLLYQEGMSKNKIQDNLYTWLEKLSGNDYQFIVDYQTDWDLLVDIMDNFPKNIDPSVLNFNQQLQTKIVLSSMKSGKLDISTKDIMSEYNNEVEDYYFKNKLPHHHALFDARAMQRGWVKIMEYLNG